MRRNGRPFPAKSRRSKQHIISSIILRQRVYLESELGELQRKKVEMLADKLLDMNLFELRYFSVMCKERI